MGQPDGGWFDETPPKVIGASPADKGVNVKQKKVNIYFDEYIKVDNPTEKVVVSPPQLEVPEIKGYGQAYSDFSGRFAQAEYYLYHRLFRCHQR